MASHKRRLRRAKSESSGSGIEIALEEPEPCGSGGDPVTEFDYQPQSENFVVIRSFSSIAEARVAEATLDSFGIEAQLSDESTIGLDWSYSAALGGVKLMVPGSDVLWSLHYLQQIAEPMPEFRQFLPDNDLPVCPACASDRVYPIEMKKKVGVVLLFASIVGIPFALAAMLFPSFRTLLGSSYECRKCSNRF